MPMHSSRLALIAAAAAPNDNYEASSARVPLDSCELLFLPGLDSRAATRRLLLLLQTDDFSMTSGIFQSRQGCERELGKVDWVAGNFF